MTELTEFRKLKAPAFDLCGVIIGHAMKVHAKLGPGFLESVYKKALQHELVRAGHRADMERPVKVLYDGIVVGDFFADMIVDDLAIVEAKANLAIAKADEVQLVNYLNATRIADGVLLNFGASSLQFKRKFRKAKQTNS